MTDTIINIYLLEDNPVFSNHFQRSLESWLALYAPVPWRVYAFRDSSSLFDNVSEIEPDLLISDIQLDGDNYDGIEVARHLHTRFPLCGIIYLTSHLECVLDIFDTDPLFFILKTEYERRLPSALQKFFTFRKAHKGNIIRVVSNNKPATIQLDSIIYCEHSGKNTTLVCTDRNYPVRASIAQMLEKLPPTQFAQCHKSFIVNLSKVRTFTINRLELDEGESLSISRTYCDSFRSAYNRWLCGNL